MKALIYKDILVMKREMMIVVCFLVTYSLLALFSDGSTIFSILGALCGAVGMLPIYTFTYDEKNRFDSYTSATPLSKRTVVLSKYMLGLLGTLLLFASMVVLMLSGRLPLSGPLVLLLTCGTLIFSFIQIPLHFLLGASKARILSIFMFFLVYFFVFTLGKNQLFNFTLPDEKGLAALALPFTAVIFAVSAYISYRIYLRKEY